MDISKYRQVGLLGYVDHYRHAYHRRHYLQLPDGSDLTLGELQEMATQQQHQIDAQQQMMVAKEQRLKFLKQQELRHQQMSVDKEKLNTLRSTVEAQELKLRKLRAIQGQVDQNKLNTTTLSSELETIRALFNEKEKELSVAVAKVDELTKQLEELRRGRQQIGSNVISSPAALELEKLRKELLYRNKLNEQQNNRMVQQRETLNNRKDEVTRMDKRISELQQRLQRKRALNQQLANQINAATSAKQAQLRNVNSNNNKNGLRPLNSQNIAAVEPYNHTPTKEQDRAHDDLHTQLNLGNKCDDLQEFIPNKNDPKYQTLPYNTKFLVQKQKPDSQGENEMQTTDENIVNERIENESPSEKNIPHPPNKNNIPNSNTNRIYPERTHHSPQISNASLENVPTVPSVKILSTSHSISNLTPKPYSSNIYNNSSSNADVPVVAAPHIVSRLPLPTSTVSTSTTSTVSAVPGTQLQSSSSQTHPVPNVSTTSVITPQTVAFNQSQDMHNLKTVPSSIVQLPTTQSLPVYQSCSMPVTVVHPHTFSSAPDGSLQEVSTEKPTDIAVMADNSNSKPALPPKPSLPNKPAIPPRQIYCSSSNEKVDTSSESVDTALTILKGSEPKIERRHAGKNIMNSFSKRVGSSALEQYMKSMNQIYKPDTGNTDSSLSEPTTAPNEDPDSKRINQNELPIKPKPLTIKKSSGVEPPKLKSSNSGTISVPTQSNNANNNANNKNSNVHINRRIEMPPAFHFPELQTSELKSNQNGNEIGDFSSKVVAPPNIVIADVSTPQEPPETVTSDFEIKNVLDVKNENDVNGNNISRVSNVVHPDDSSLSSSDSQITDGSQANTEKSSDEGQTSPEQNHHSAVHNKVKKGNLKTESSVKNNRRVSFDPHALLLDASLEGELFLVKKTAKKVPNPSAANDEGITALHNAICAGHFEVVKFLVEFGCDVNAQDSDGWTPLHCAASCNNLPMVKFLVENGACIFATTLSDHETAAEKCEEDEEGFDGCSEYLYSIQEKLGILNNGVVFAVYDFEAHNADELSYDNGDMITVLRKGDEFEREWWWSRINDREGYIPRNLLGLYPRRILRPNQESY